MKKVLTVLTLAFVVALMVAPTAFASHCSGGSKKASAGCAATCGSKAKQASASCAATCGSQAKQASAGCSVAYGDMAMSGADCCTPAMKAACEAGAIDCKSTRLVYRVVKDGEPYDTMSRAEAFDVVGKTGTPVKFVAGGTAFDGEDQAVLALASQIEAHVATLLTVETVDAAKPAGASSCSAGAKSVYRVCGKEIGCGMTAKSWQAKAAQAAESVKITEAEDGKTLVVGDQVAKSEADAKLLLAQSKLSAVLEAIWGQS